MSNYSEEIQMVLQRAKDYLVDFEIVTNNKYIPNWHHEIIGKELEHIERVGDRDYKILLISSPPRSGKSQMCSIDFPAWYLGRNPDKEIITSSYSGDLAQEFGSKTREKVMSKEFQAIFPKVILREDEQAKGHWRTNKGGGYLSVGVGGAITGRGANILLLDDVFKNREEADSEVMRNKIYGWFTSTAFTRLEPNGVVIIIGTRWHLDDLIGRIRENPDLAKRVKEIRFPALDDSFDGGVLWKDRFPLEVILEIQKTLGPYDFSSLYQGLPITSENQEFKPEWFKRITEYEVQQMSTRRYLTIDTAMSKKTTADFTGFCDNRVNKENFWHLKGWKEKIDADELINRLFVLQEQNHYERIGIEKTAYLEGLKPSIEREQRKRGVFLPMVDLKHNQTAKEIRIRGLVPRYSSGSIFHIQGECKTLEDELQVFPLGKHDDCGDALAYMLQIADNPSNQGRKVEVFRPKTNTFSRYFR